LPALESIHDHELTVDDSQPAESHEELTNLDSKIKKKFSRLPETEPKGDLNSRKQALSDKKERLQQILTKYLLHQLVPEEEISNKEGDLEDPKSILAFVREYLCEQLPEETPDGEEELSSLQISREDLDREASSINDSLLKLAGDWDDIKRIGQTGRQQNTWED